MKTLFLWSMMMCCALIADAATKATLVDYTVDGKDYQGYLVRPEVLTEPRPAVVVFPEWWGINDYVKGRARELAELGYIAFVADMYGKGVVTTKAEEAKQYAGAFYQDFNRFETMTSAAYEQMLMQDFVDTARTGAIGFCFGGTAALELARNGADVKATVVFHGGLISPDSTRAKHIQGRVLVLQGDSDPFTPASDVAAFEREMNSAEVDYRIVHYPNAMHAFTNPKAGETGLSGVSYDEKAAANSMEEMRVLFSELFARPR
ncbi:MAG: dienelactone hydrolase family protein [bacterium]|nr:dienelactone hydrolase family protein [bacterium]